MNIFMWFTRQRIQKMLVQLEVQLSSNFDYCQFVDANKILRQNPLSTLMSKPPIHPTPLHEQSYGHTINHQSYDKSLKKRKNTKTYNYIIKTLFHGPF